MKKVILISFLSLLILSGASCVNVKVAGNDGGIYKSSDKGLNWEQKTAVLSVGQPKNISGVNLSTLVFGPQDSQTLYLGTKEDGLFISHNGGEAWQMVEKLPRSKINAIAPDPKEKHIIYVSIGGQIFKSDDSGQSWQNIYLEAVPGVEITSLAVDSADNSKILAGLSDNRLLRSTNGGISWTKLHEFGAKIKQILFNPKNTGIIYIVTAGNGIWRSTDGGADWQSLDPGLQNYSGGREVEWTIFDPTKADALLTVSPYGLLRTDDGGGSWFDYKLLSQPNRVKIFSFTINPKNPQEIFYSTATTFYQSFDGGKNWRTKSLPTKRTPTILLTDPNNPNIIYMGVAKME